VEEHGRAIGFGIDIGGSGIKGARVDLTTGELASERIKILTPQPATPEAVVAVIGEIVQEAEWAGPFGCTFPGIVRHGVLHSAANMGKAWIGVHLEELVHDATGHQVAVLNDADAAGLAEARFGAARDRDGVVIMTTLGTGIGSAVFVDGHLLPNSELGHLQMYGKSAEKRAAASVRQRKGLAWEEWAARLQEYYSHLEFLLSPDLIIVGGGVSRKSEKFLPLLDLQAEVIPAQLQNQAGIVGAAVVAAERFEGGLPPH
jgi:polyphosphate glucokinase